MRRFFQNNGGLLLVAAVLLTAVVALGTQILGFNTLNNALEVLATPFRAASSAVSNWTRSGMTGRSGTRSLPRRTRRCASGWRNWSWTPSPARMPSGRTNA